MSEKFPGHGIVGPNAGARPGGSGQNISRENAARDKIAPKNFRILSTQRIAARPGPDFIYTKNLRAPGIELSSTQRIS